MVPLKPGGLKLGQQYLGINRRKAVIWPTRSVVAVLEPEQALAWDTRSSGARWIYELESDYSNYLAALGAPTKLVRKYAYRNALLPQITGLALALGAVVAGAIVVEIVFSYPGLGTLTLSAIQNRDYFLIQGIFLFLITGVLIANFLIDVFYVVIDPRTRIGMQGN